MSAFLPGNEQQAVAFGWASSNGLPLHPNRYWICQLGPNGATPHWLPDDLSQHCAQRVGWQVVDHLDGCWWLLPMGLSYSANQVLACAEK